MKRRLNESKTRTMSITSFLHNRASASIAVEKSYESRRIYRSSEEWMIILMNRRLFIYSTDSVGLLTIVDRVGFEPTTSAMPMPYPTGLDDRPHEARTILLVFGINTFNELKRMFTHS